MRKMMCIIALAAIGCEEKKDAPSTAAPSKTEPTAARAGTAPPPQTPPSAGTTAAPPSGGAPADTPAAPAPAAAAGAAPTIGAPIAVKADKPAAGAAAPVSFACTKIEKAGAEWSVSCDRTNTGKEPIDSVTMELCFYKGGKKVGQMHENDSFAQGLKPGGKDAGKWDTGDFKGDKVALAGAVMRPMLTYVGLPGDKVWSTPDDCPASAP